MMKKIYIALLISSAAAFTSCDMDTEQAGVITIENALKTKTDCDKFMNTIYNNLRSTTAGAYMSRVELQMDKFVGTVNNGNRGMLFSSASIEASNSDVESIFYGMYVGINNCNYFIPGAQAILDGGNVQAKDAEDIKYKIGAAKFARAYYYTYLMDHFCETYSSANANTPAKGLPIVLVYSPSANRGSYPGRSTLQETVNQINTDLTEAYDAVKAYEDNVSMQYVTPCAAYINSYAIEALQARVALLTGDYKTALEKAEDVIGSMKFTLSEGDDYKTMWTTDEGTELIFVPFGDLSEYGSVPNTGATWLTNDDENTSDFIPTPSAVSVYDNGDVRKEAFFTEYDLLWEGNEATGPVFCKYPGNPLFNDGAETRLTNKPKPFRTSELYLIAAEAAASDGPQKNEGTALAYLNELRAARIDGYQEISGLTGANLMNAIRDERTKELIGEGFRMSDLRRWGQGFNRTANYVNLGYDAVLNSFIQPNSNNVNYTPGYYMYIWPLPQAELDVNPQLAGQQNLGYY